MLLVADEGAVEAGGAAVGEDVGDGVVDGVVGVAVVGAVVALDVEGLGGFADDDGLFGDLRGLDGGHRLGLGAGGDGAEVASRGWAWSSEALTSPTTAMTMLAGT